MKRIFCLLLGLCMAVSLCACSKDADASDPSNSSFTDIPDEPQNGVGTAYPDRAYGFQLEPPAAGETIAVMHTSLGDISIRFFPEAAPKAVENFVTHAQNGYYDGLTFHRVIQNFMIQGGDPKGTGSGGESIWGKAFEDEFDQKLMNLRGSLAMANSGVNTNGSQFFINQSPASQFKGKEAFDYTAMMRNIKLYYDAYVKKYGSQFTSEYPNLVSYAKASLTPISKWVPEEVWDLYAKTGGNIHLDGAWRWGGGHTVFGQVFDGMDVVDAIAAVAVDENSKPTEAVTIQSITVTTYTG